MTSPSKSLEPCYLAQPNGFEHGIKLRILRLMLDYPGRPNIITCPHEREHGDLTAEERHLRLEARD
jgi:hypothetical protein